VKNLVQKAGRRRSIRCRHAQGECRTRGIVSGLATGYVILTTILEFGIRKVVESVVSNVPREEDYIVVKNERGQIY